MMAVRLVSYDNSHHSHNENLRFLHFWRGIGTYAPLLVLLCW